MVKLYDRTIGLIKTLALMDWEICPDCDEYKNMIVEARAILRELDLLS